MKYFIRGLLACVAFLAVSPLLRADYYYSSGVQIPLRADTAKIVVKFDSLVPQQQVFQNVSRLQEVVPDNNVPIGFSAVSIIPGGNLYAFLDTLNATFGIKAAEPYYYLQDTVPYTVGDRFIVGVDSTFSYSDVAALAASHGCVIVRSLVYQANTYVLRNANPRTQRLLAVANQIHAETGVLFSHPSFAIHPVKCNYKLYDHYNANQGHLKKIIGNYNSASVWDFCGVKDTIIVAVIDDGVTSHEDLPASRVMSGVDFSHEPFDNNAAPGNSQGHGMGCAGIIAASQTTDSIAGLSSSTGVVGMSPAVKILPVKIFQDNGGADSLTIEALGDAIVYAWAAGADIISCSWGFNFADTGVDEINIPLREAATVGRGGKGCPIVFAAGNGSVGVVFYPANRPECFAVGAVNLSDARWSYSNYGSALSLVAPSGNTNLVGDVWTLDQMSTAGFNPNYPVTWGCSNPNDVDYDCHFGGTSAACPFVSGTAALLLSKSRNLTRTQVYTYLDSSAVQIGATHPNTQYGWGRVDAFRAVLSISHGDVNSDGIVNLADLSLLSNYLSGGGYIPFPSVLLGDWNCSGFVDLADLSAMVAYLQGRGSVPVKPCFKF